MDTADQIKRSVSYPANLLFGHSRSLSDGHAAVPSRTAALPRLVLGRGWLGGGPNTDQPDQSNDGSRRGVGGLCARGRKGRLGRPMMLLMAAMALFFGMWTLHEIRRRHTGADHCPKPIYGMDTSEELEAQRNGTRIVICTGAYSNVVDGVSRTLNRLVRDLNDGSDGDNYKVLVLAPTRDPPAMEHYGALLPLPSMQLPFRGEYSFSTGLSDCVSKRLTEFNPQIMHIATPDLVASQVQQWAIDRHIPTVCSYHTRFTSYLPYYFKGVTLDAIDSTIWWWLRKFHMRCEHIYPPTKGVATELVQQGFPKEAMRLWPRGVLKLQYLQESEAVTATQSAGPLPTTLQATT